MLFNAIFDNTKYAKQVFYEYKPLFDEVRPVIGMTVRRGDFIATGGRVYTETQLRNEVKEVLSKHYGRAKVLVTSDDI